MWGSEGGGCGTAGGLWGGRGVLSGRGDRGVGGGVGAACLLAPCSWGWAGGSGPGPRPQVQHCCGPDPDPAVHQELVAVSPVSSVP